MPVYLCQPGADQAEPWRHGVQVFSSPCPIDSNTTAAAAAESGGGAAAAAATASATERNLIVACGSFPDNPETAEQQQQHQQQNLQAQLESPPAYSLSALTSSSAAAGRGTRTTTSLSSAPPQPQQQQQQQPVRRVRHAELVLVDDVCIAHGRYWLRLRWPGHRGGFAGYIAMGLVSEGSPPQPQEFSPGAALYSTPSTDAAGSGGGAAAEDADLDDPTREETGSMPPAEPGELILSSPDSQRTLTCARTGLAFQSSSAMRLLGLYDDGVTPPVALAPLPTESVFCRICREGLHDDADDEQPPAEQDGTVSGDDAAAAAASSTSVTPTTSRFSRSRFSGRGRGAAYDAVDEDNEERSVGGSAPPDGAMSTSYVAASKGPVVPHPLYSHNADAVRNPILAPCECSGSMAFVHYLCVEQWRCRSRHPDAHNGLNCETCGSAYALPPPAERQVQVPPHVGPGGVMAGGAFDQDQDDWLEAMPPHVMQALRQPHIWWQLGAGIVRRRWLRPIAPVLMSPVVALYCRARRLLKKRGVARRRWACSLCRRRARWKCVRCLRSYYCSRQCQNVSWHIIHKHVCYKPVRFWWSIIVYTAVALALFPGYIRDPLMYDIGLLSVPVSFVITGILGGSGATLVKKTTGIDLRGRLLEFMVVLSTALLSYVSWGLIRGFFGDPHACHGLMGTYEITADHLQSGISLVKVFQTAVLQPLQWFATTVDQVFSSYTGLWLRAVFCRGGSGSAGAVDAADLDSTTATDSSSKMAAAATLSTTCFEHLPHSNADFFLQEEGGELCAADMVLLLTLYVVALFSFCGSALAKAQERRLRRERMEQRRHHHHHQQRQQQQPRRPFAAAAEVHLHQE